MRNFINIISEKYLPTTGATNDAALADLLAPAGKSAAIGPEKGEIKPNGISRLVSAYGSTRYVFSENGKPVSVLQVMSRDGTHGVIANVYTVPEARRRHLAFALMTMAKRDFESVRHSDDLTNDGAAWASAVEEDREPEIRPQAAILD